MSYDNLINSVLGQYELRERLGKGGMGAVYRAFQANLNREVAVKVLSEDLADEPHFVERFKREAATAASLEHSHIVPVYDFGNLEDITYVAMRLLDGESLGYRLKAVAMAKADLPDLREVTKLLDHISGALDYAHGRGVIHRDIKPSNIMYDAVGNVFIVDFGIAKLINATSQITAAGMMMGTPAYMAPEQWRNEEVSAVTDQYAVGIMMYQVLVGRPPFEAPTPYGLMHKHINDHPKPPHTTRDDLSEAVSDVLARAMAKKMADRFPTMTAFSEAFRGAIEHQRFASTMAPTPASAANRTPPMDPTIIPQVDQIRPNTPPPAPPPLQANAPLQTPPQQLPWNMPPAYNPSTQPQSFTEKNKAPVVALIGVVASIIAIIVGVMVLSGGGDDENPVQVSAIDSAERYLNAIVGDDADTAKANACSDVYDETDAIVRLFEESGGIPPLENVVCEEDGENIDCTFVSEGSEQTTFFTVDNQNRVCGGEIIELARSMNDVSSEESSSSQLPTLAPLPTSRHTPTLTVTSRFTPTATPTSRGSTSQ